MKWWFYVYKAEGYDGLIPKGRLDAGKTRKLDDTQKQYIRCLLYTSPKQKKKMPHFESWIAKDGTEIWIGKNNLQNDFLTFKHARKQYYWFHVKDMPGSHVIVCQDTLDEYLIRLAANLAALYSKAAYSSSVPVNYAKVQSLKKAPGGIPGKVILSHYKTIYIDPDPAVHETLTKKGA